MRDFFLRGCVVLGAVTAVLTECLSLFHWLRRGPVTVAWLLLAAFAVVRFRRRWKPPRLAFRLVEGTITLAIAAIVAVAAFTAIVSPPNSSDALAYHLPRVVYWEQAGSVAFFPTDYFNQISLQPLAEYFSLHTYLFSGGDHFVNLIACASFAAALVGISALAGALGLGSRGQAFAALFCATLPNGILQASGAKNDWMLALWLICAAYWATREDAPLTGVSLGLALATKATAYLFAPPLLLAVVLVRRTPFRARSVAWIAVGILLMNTPQYVRNLRLSGSPMGYDSAQGDGVYRWRNEHPGWKSTVSNLIRHTSEQLGGRYPRWNATVFNYALELHRALGLDPNDRNTTWRYATFTAPVNANHEASGNNRWHLLLLAIAVLFAAVTRNRTWILYAAGLIVALLLYCFFLKWQPYMARLLLPLFALASPLAAAFLEALRPAILALLVCLFLTSGARLPLFQNWIRPLQGPHSLFTVSRDENYFRDIWYWNYHASYLPSIDLVARLQCGLVGIDISQNTVEYPLQALLRERNPAVRFVHTGVENASARYAPADQPKPCAVICPDCVGLPGKIALYRNIGPPIALDTFVLFLPTDRVPPPAK